MDVRALEYLCCVSEAHTQLEHGTDPQQVRQAASELRVLEHGHTILSALDAKAARLIEASRVVPRSDALRRLCEV